MTMAATIQAVQRPALIIAHNKTLAAQLCNEFRTYFPNNAVEYFVSYYDYYQPEAYVPSKDLYIEKDSAINQEIDRLRHAATAGLFARRDVVIVASVSCIFGLGSPAVYDENLQTLNKGEMIDRDKLLRKLVSIQYTRNDTALARGTFRVRGETLEIFPAYAETAYRIVLFGDEVEHLQHFDPVTGELIEDDLEHVAIWPASHYNVREGMIEDAVAAIGAELNARCAELEQQGKLLESHRLRQRTQYDMEMLRELGFCSGIENYSRILDGRNPGDRPYCLLDYFPEDFVCFLDESHQTVPQIGGMHAGDRSRKQTLVDYGFRLPSALDNRPQTFAEFLSITPQMVFVSATPGEYERSHSPRIVEQIVRPTGIIDPAVEVRETKNQIDDLMNEIRGRVDREERTLVTTLTKKMSEDLTDYLLEMGFKVRYLHSEIDTLERIQIIRDLRLGEYDVLVGVNLLREGLDLPEVSLVGDPRRRQGGLPARGDLADPDDRPRRAQRRRQGADVRRQGDRGDAGRDGGDRPPPGDPAGLQHRARDHSGDDRQGHLRHRRVPDVGLQGAQVTAPPQALRDRDGARRDREGDRRTGGGDARRGRGAALRVRGQAARRDPRPQARTGPGGRRRLTRRFPDLRLKATAAGSSSGTLGLLQTAVFNRRYRVALDRQSIEKKDFPVGRRGYDPEAVDAHLSALADEIADLKRSARRRSDTLASSASDQVRAIVEAAENSAADIQRDAENEAREIRDEANAEAQATREQATEQAREYVGKVSESTDTMLKRLDAMENELGSLIESLRTGGNRLTADLKLLESNLTEVSGAVVARGPQFEPEEPAVLLFWGAGLT